MNVISIRDLGKEGIEKILGVADKMLPYFQEKCMYSMGFSDLALAPKVTFLFLESSTRTSESFKEAADFLGFRHSTYDKGKDSTIYTKNESFASVVRMLILQQGADILVMRTSWEGAPKFAAEIVAWNGKYIPIINGGDGAHDQQSVLHAFLSYPCAMIL